MVRWIDYLRSTLCDYYVIFLGQQDDARMNLAIALTAARMGATVVNHVSVTSLLKDKDENGKEVICGVTCRDEMTCKTLVI